MQKMRELLFDFAILGGYPRDIALGREPKDMDICVYNYHPTDQAEITFSNVLKAWLEERNMIAEAHDKMHPSNPDKSRIYHVVTLKCGVDIIFWNAKTKWEVIHRFDFNINQYELAVQDDSWTPIFHGNNHGVLQHVRAANEILPERLDHIIDIADSFEWDTTQCLHNRK